MLNVTLIGNLGADPTIGPTRRGAEMATLRVAVNQLRTDRVTGERTETTEWFRVRAAGRLVDAAGRLTSGARVLVIGRLSIGHYQSKEGEARVSFDVWADELLSVSPRVAQPAPPNGTRRHDEQSRTEQGAAVRPSEGRPARGEEPRRPAATAARTDEIDDDDLPW